MENLLFLGVPILKHITVSPYIEKISVVAQWFKPWLADLMLPGSRPAVSGNFSNDGSADHSLS